MSVGFDCYTAEPVTLDTIIGKTWQIVVDPPIRITDHEFPAAWRKAIGKRRQLVRIHIEGRTDTRTDKAFNALVRKLTDKHKAVVIDLQSLEAWTSTRRVQLPQPARGASK